MTPLFAVSISISLGFFLGIIFYWLLKINSKLYLRDKKIWRGVFTHLARLATLGLAFWYISNFGAVALLSSFAGFLVGRLVSMNYLLKEKV